MAGNSWVMAVATPETNLDVPEYDILECLSGNYSQYEEIRTIGTTAPRTLLVTLMEVEVTSTAGSAGYFDWMAPLRDDWVRPDSTSPTGGLCTYYFDGQTSRDHQCDWHRVYLVIHET